jgi:hypothetical protein
VLTVDVAQPDSADQSRVTGLDHDRQLIVEQFIWPVALEQSQIDRGQLVDTESEQIGFDVTAQVGGLGEWEPGAGVVATPADLAYQGQVLRVRMQRLADELVGDVGAIELSGVDVVDAEVDGAAQHRKRLIAVPRRAEHTGTGQLHRPEPDTGDRIATKWKGIHRVRLASRNGHFPSARRTPRW